MHACMNDWGGGRCNGARVLRVRKGVTHVVRGTHLGLKPTEVLRAVGSAYNHGDIGSRAHVPVGLFHNPLRLGWCEEQQGEQQ
jgi:hypothetical protein